MTPAPDVDSLFQSAVGAIDTGSVENLKSVLEREPQLASSRLEAPGAWLRDVVGNALETFFVRPYLLWFVAEDPVRNGTLPANIAEVTRTIVASLSRVPTRGEQLDYAMKLVAWSPVARKCGVQIELIDVLADAGASLDGAPEEALVNGGVDAAAHLIAIGAPLTLQSAVCVGRFDDVDELARSATVEQKEDALVLAALNGKAAGVRKLIELGVPPTTTSARIFPHATALHHAAGSGSLDAVRALVEAGADTEALDTAWGGTPAGWAEYGKHAEIAQYLRGR